MSDPIFKHPRESAGAFAQAFQNLWAVLPHLKDEPVMYMYTQGGIDYFKHVETREYYRVQESNS
jgi:hypothetical protein|tara:strand:- start:2234 stop:2425 length:192 start_codon:yes stop_codon:yes gene_type:complete